MSVISATLIRYRHGRYSRNALERDLDAIRSLYRGNGFRDVEVTSRVIDDYNRSPAHIAIFLCKSPKMAAVVRSKLNLQGVSKNRGPRCCCCCIPPPDSRIASSTSPPIATTYSITISTTNIRREIRLHPNPVRPSESNRPDVYRHAGRTYLCAQRCRGWAEANPARRGDGPHQCARGRSAVSKRDQR